MTQSIKECVDSTSIIKHLDSIPDEYEERRRVWVKRIEDTIIEIELEKTKDGLFMDAGTEAFTREAKELLKRVDEIRINPRYMIRYSEGEEECK